MAIMSASLVSPVLRCSRDVTSLGGMAVPTFQVTTVMLRRTKEEQTDPGAQSCSLSVSPPCSAPSSVKEALCLQQKWPPLELKPGHLQGALKSRWRETGPCLSTPPGAAPFPGTRQTPLQAKRWWNSKPEHRAHISIAADGHSRQPASQDIPTQTRSPSPGILRGPQPPARPRRQGTACDSGAASPAAVSFSGAKAAAVTTH